MTNYNNTVSIVTITQLSRNKCLKNLCEFISNQTYTNIIEWVIIEGSKSEKDAKLNQSLILELQSLSIIPIVYVEYISGYKLSDLRNIGNTTCRGDIIVTMDDDDYYPPLRVEDVVNGLNSSHKEIAGCSNVLMYEYSMNKLFQFNQFHPNHSTNNCMGFKKSYLQTHSHDTGLEFAEEASFTNNFSEEMVQLNPINCIVVSSHCTNTFDKRILCTKENANIREITEDIYKYIPLKIINKIRQSL